MNAYIVKTNTNGVEKFELVYGDYSYSKIISTLQDAIIDPDVEVKGVVEVTISGVISVTPMINGSTFTVKSGVQLERVNFDGDAVYVVLSKDIYSNESALVFAGGSDALKSAKGFALRSMNSDNDTIRILKISQDLTKCVDMIPSLEGFNFELIIR